MNGLSRNPKVGDALPIGEKSKPYEQQRAIPRNIQHPLRIASSSQSVWSAESRRNAETSTYVKVDVHESECMRTNLFVCFV